MVDHVHLLDFVVLDVTRGQANPLLEWWCLAIHVHEDEAADGVAAQFGQARAVCDEIRVESLFIGDALQLAVLAELPAMEGTGELVDRALRVQRNLVRTVRTDVVERLDAVIVLAYHQEAFVAVLMHQIVARLLDVRRDADENPDARPQVRPLLLHELLGVVASRVDDIQSVIRGRQLGIQSAFWRGGVQHDGIAVVVHGSLPRRQRLG